MTPHNPFQRGGQALATALIALLLTVSCATAQTTRHAKPGDPAAPTTPPPTPGLDGYNDSALVSTLYLRGADALADRLVKIHNLDPATVNALRFPILVQELAKTGTTTAQRDALIQQIVVALPLALPNITDFHVLMDTVGKFKDYLQRGLDLHDYWGEDQNDQKAAMLPVATGATQCMDRAIGLLEAQKAELLAGVPPSNPGAAQGRLDQYDALDRLEQIYSYNKPFLAYYLAIAMQAADPNRIDVCDQAIQDLGQYAGNGDMTAQAQIAKLQMAKFDFSEARKAFQLVINAPTASVADKDTAYYFAAVNEIIAKDAKAAHAAYDALLAWNKQNAAARDKAADAQIDAAAQMLQYRLAILDANNAPNAAAQAQGVAAANGILLTLVNTYPQYRPIILQNLKKNLPAKPNVKTLDPLMLEALAQAGGDVVSKAHDTYTPAEITAMENAAMAAEELLTRPGINPADQERYLFFAGFYWDKADDDMKAIDDYLSYLNKYPVGPHSSALLKNRRDLAVEGAVDSAVHWYKTTRVGSDDNSSDFKRYKQCMALAAVEGQTNPNYVPFFYIYGKLLVNSSPPLPKDAIEWLALVPANDKNFRTAKYWEMISNKELSQSAKDPDEVKKYTERTLQLAGEVSKGFADDAQAAATDADKQRFRRMSALTSIQAADLAMKVMHDPPAALKFLDGIEAKLDGIPGADALLAQALQIKILGLLDAKQNDQAVAVLKDLVQKDPRKAFTQVGLVIDKLAGDYRNLEGEQKKALADNDQAAADKALDGMRQVNSQIKDLTDMALSPGVMPANMDPKERAQWDGFNLVVQRRTAVLETDPAKKAADLRGVVAAFDSLIAKNPDNLLLKVQQADVYFELQDYAKAWPVFNDFYTNHRYGDPTSIDPETGKLIPNEKFWDLAYKYWKTCAEIGKSDPSKKDYIESAVKNMKIMYINYGPELAGTSSRPLIDELRKEIAPDFDPAKYAAAPTTAPAAK